MTKERIIELIETEGLTIEELVHVVIDYNAIIGVGLISLADTISDYIYKHYEINSTI